MPLSGKSDATIGVLGVGRVGSAVARQALKAGYRVKVSGSRDPEHISLLTEIVIPGAEPVTAADAASSADLVVLAVPLHKYRTLPVEALAGKIVIDSMNYWAPIDGVIEEFEGRSSSELVQEFLPTSRIVKTLGHIGYHELESDDQPAGTPGRRALGIAGDDDEAKQVVARFIDSLGYDVVDAGSLLMGEHFQPGTPIFSGRHSAADIRSILDEATTATTATTAGLTAAE